MTTVALDDETRQELLDRQTVLVETNVAWLRQALDLLEQIDDRTFSTSPTNLAPHRAGSHLRHILEFYECFLDGVAGGRIDYDARRRDESVERQRSIAAERIRSIIRRLQVIAMLGDFEVLVRMEDTAPGTVRDPFLTSSVTRELQTLSSHTIHHFALIAVTLRMHGVDLHPDFGMAPSTLRFHAHRSGAA